MTTKLRAYVRRCDMPGCGEDGRPWIGAAGEVTLVGTTTTAYAEHHASWPEAMQAAYKLLADLENELMDEVHASRAARREDTPTDAHTMEATA